MTKTPIHRKAGPHPGKETAAAVAAAGAAVVGGKLAWERLSAPAHEPSRAYRLNEGEFLPDGIRRIARGQLDDASEELGGASPRKLAKTVHETRKRLKRLRTLVRTGRAGFGEDTYRRENDAFSEAGRMFSGARDATVLVATLDGLTDRFPHELSAETLDPLRARLKGRQEQAVESLREDHGAVDAVLTELKAARERTAGWNFETAGFEALAPGLRRIYRRGRRAMRAVADDPSTENLHEWRKRAKDLWHATQIVRPAAPKSTKRLARRAHALSDLLGDDHDLAVLRDYVEAHPECFEDDSSRAALVAIIDRRRQALQHEALELGKDVYRRSPKGFERRIERGWRKRAAKQAQPAAL